MPASSWLIYLNGRSTIYGILCDAIFTAKI